MRSNFEKKVARHLTRMKVKYKYERETFVYETKLVVQKARCACCGGKDLLVSKSYTPDFFLGNGVIIEAKGRWTPEHRRIALNFPDVKLLFMRDNYLSKGSKTRYSDWCIKHGIDYHVSYYGAIPERWIQ